MNYAVIDTETTGTPGAPWARVVEIGAVAYSQDGHELGAFSTLVCPSVLDERAQRALDYNGIDFEAVANAPTESSVTDSFFRWLEAYSVEKVYAFNEVFDKTMLERSGIRLRWGGCIMQAARVRMGVSAGPSLHKAADFFRVPYSEHAHRALADARCAGGVHYALQRTRAA